jgi:hypothetical protein
MATEIELLVEIINNNHQSVMGAIGSLETSFKEQRRFCDDRFDDVELDVKTHDRTISRYKGIIGVTCAIWGAIVSVASFAALILWG